jgi:hypothetical protein
MTSKTVRHGEGAEFPGALKAIIISCDHVGCPLELNDTQIGTGGGLRALDWAAVPLDGKLLHFCPTHREHPEPRPAIEAIAIERERQILIEGFTPESNDHYAPGTLAAAAACYAAGEQLNCWPWGDEWWKPGPTRRRDMEKAGALIAAEIEHIDRTTTAHVRSTN